LVNDKQVAVNHTFRTLPSKLAFSHWSYFKIIMGEESFTALAEGLQEAFYGV